MSGKATILYIPHGGGPLPLMGDPGHDTLVRFLRQIPGTLPRPKAVLVISAHWERDIPLVTAHPRPEMIYDYSGFPKAAYDIRYPAPGAPDLAARVTDCLTRSGLKARCDEERGFDHGLYIPLALMLPGADIPCIQISLCADLDPLSHLRIGEALGTMAAPDLSDLWILGSGFSFHNMAAFGSSGPDHDRTEKRNRAFQDWLRETCAGQGMMPTQRKDRLVRWELAPHARYCHPREEHLLPLMVCAGMAGYAKAEIVFDGQVMGRHTLAFLWQGDP